MRVDKAKGAKQAFDVFQGGVFARLYPLYGRNMFRYFVVWLLALLAIAIVQVFLDPSYDYLGDYVFWLNLIFFGYVLIMIPQGYAIVARILRKSRLDLDSFHPFVGLSLNSLGLQLSVATAGGFLALAAVSTFGVAWRYPSPLFVFIFGFLLWLSVLLLMGGSSVMSIAIRRSADKIEVFHPDGMGGLSWLADKLAYGLIRVMLFEAIVLSIVSSAHFVDLRGWSLFILIWSTAMIALSVGFLLHVLVPLHAQIVAVKERALERISQLSKDANRRLAKALEENVGESLQRASTEHAALLQLYDRTRRVREWPIRNTPFLGLILAATNLVVAPLAAMLLERLFR